jgi:succinate dehydrogenase/fumarate reductase cytochrome b subunit
MRKFGILEWLWAAHAISGLALLVCLLATNGLYFGLALGVLMSPVGLAITFYDGSSSLPDGLMAIIYYLLVLLNGGFFYGSMKLLI